MTSLKLVAIGIHKLKEETYEFYFKTGEDAECFTEEVYVRELVKFLDDAIDTLLRKKKTIMDREQAALPKHIRITAGDKD